MSKHTPGPWKAMGEGFDHYVQAGKYPIAIVKQWPEVDGRQQANAELIAQAPDLKQQRDDLLAALKGVIELASNEADALSELDDNEHDEDAEEAQDLVAKAREVIAQVEGNQ